MNKHLSDLQLVGKDAAHMFVTLLIGMVLGAFIDGIPVVNRQYAGGGQGGRCCLDG